jgi:hypothetical protein
VKDRCDRQSADLSGEAKKVSCQPPKDVRLTPFARPSSLAAISIRLFDQLGVSKADAYLDTIDRRLRAESVYYWQQGPFKALAPQPFYGSDERQQANES